ncbi:MAG: hypothetical protein WCF84_06970 [Anaerolineae bacterium]
MSAIVFAPLLKAPQWLHALGFPIIATLLPLSVVVISTSISYQRLNLLPEPLALLIVFIWIALTLPFALLVAGIYLIIVLMARRKQNRINPSLDMRLDDKAR